MQITRLLRTLKSLGITLSVTFKAGEPANGRKRLSAPTRPGPLPSQLVCSRHERDA